MTGLRCWEGSWINTARIAALALRVGDPVWKSKRLRIRAPLLSSYGTFHMPNAGRRKCLRFANGRRILITRYWPQHQSDQAETELGMFTAIRNSWLRAPRSILP